MAADLYKWNDGREQALLQYIKSHPEFESFRGNPRQMLTAIDEFTYNHDFLINIGSDKGRVMSNIITERLPATVVELGGYLGYSSILFACTLREVMPKDTPFKIWSLEYSPEFSNIARELIEIAGLERDIAVVTGAAADSIRLLRAEDRIQHIDMLFIDHGEGGIELYETDLKLCEELGLLKSGAYIVADNVVRPGAPEYRKYVRNHSGFRSQGIKALIMPGEFEDELEVTVVI